jgi:hypothetical protein
MRYTSDRLRRQLLQKEDITLEKVLEMTRVHDCVETQAKLIEGDKRQRNSSSLIRGKRPNRPTPETLNSIQDDLNNWHAMFTVQDDKNNLPYTTIKNK